MRTKLLLTGLAIFVMAVFAGACGGDDGPGSAATPAAGRTAAASASAQAAVAPGGTLRVAFRQDITGGFDPGSAGASSELWLSNLIYESLVGANPDSSLRPLLAQSWESTPDGRTWTFRLRTGVKFTDGSDLTAEVVKFNFDRILQGSPVKGIYASYLAADGVSVVDPTTVRFALLKPYGLFPNLLSLYPGVMASQKAIQSGIDLSKNPIGTGPFKLESFTPGSKIAYTKNTAYWAKDESGVQLPYLDRLEWSIIPDAGQRLNAIQAGEADLSFSLDTALFAQIKGNTNLQPVLFEASRLGGMIFNTAKPPFDKPDVRRAFSLALDRSVIHNVAFAQVGQPATSIFPKGSIYYDAGGDATKIPDYARNVARAKQLLTQAGYGNGLDLPQVRILVAVEYPDVVRAMEVAQQQLAEAGIRIGGVETCPVPQCSPRWLSGQFDITIPHFPNQGDPLILLQNLYYSKGNWNYGKWPGTPDLDAAIDAAIGEPDAKKRVELAQKAQLLALNAGAGRYEVFFRAAFDVAGKKVSGYRLLPNDLQRRWDIVGFSK